MFKLFLTFLKIGAFTFGGGYAMVPLIEDELVNKQKLLNIDDFTDLLAIAQSYPGVMAANISILLGYRLYGFFGAVIALLGSIIPSFFIVMTVTYFYFQNQDSKFLDGFFHGVRPVVIALLLYTFIRFASKLPKNILNIVLLLVSFLCIGILKISPIYLIIIGGVFSIWRK